MSKANNGGEYIAMIRRLENFIKRVEVVKVADLSKYHSAPAQTEPGMVVIGELILSMMDRIASSISAISASNSRFSLIVCLSFKAFTGIYCR